MEPYKPSSDKEPPDDIANYMIQQASTAMDSVVHTYGDDKIEVYVSNDRRTVKINWNESINEVPYMDSVDALRTTLEESIRTQAFCLTLDGRRPYRLTPSRRRYNE